MTRFASSTNETESAQPDIQICIAVDLDFPSGHVRLTDAIGDITIGGYTYSGNGQFNGIDKIEEGIEIISRSVQFQLSGVDSEMVTIARAGGYQSKTVTLYLAFYNKTTQSLLDTPEIIWEGFIDTMSIRLAQNEASITVNCEHRLRREPRIARYTDADQQLAHSGDNFFDQVPKIPGYVSRWGVRDTFYQRLRGSLDTTIRNTLKDLAG